MVSLVVATLFSAPLPASTQARWSIEVSNVRTREVQTYSTRKELRFTVGKWVCNFNAGKPVPGSGPGQVGADLDCTRTMEKVEITVGTQSSSCLVRDGRVDEKSRGALRLSLLAVDPAGPETLAVNSGPFPACRSKHLRVSARNERRWK